MVFKNKNKNENSKFQDFPTKTLFEFFELKSAMCVL
jgi:hypothetical protein